MSDMYMNGRGITERTNRLVDAVWDSMGMALVGSVVATMGLAPALLAFAFGRSTTVLALAIAFAIIGIVFGVWLNIPWLRALRALRELRTHTRLVRAETAKRGKGWASS